MPDYNARPDVSLSDLASGVSSGETFLVEDDQFAHRTVHYSAKQAARARDVLQWLHSLRRAAQFYPLDHSVVIEQEKALGEAIQTYHDEGVELQFAFFEGEILLGDQLLAEESVDFDQLAWDMQTMGVGSLIFTPGVTLEELARAARLLGVDAADATAAGGILKLPDAGDLPHIKIGIVRAADDVVEAPDEEARKAFATAVEFMQDIDETVLGGEDINPVKVRTVVGSLVSAVLQNRYSALQLAGLKSYDEYTFYHSVNVAILSLGLGSILNNDERFLTVLGTAALLHDIGKLAIGRDIINKKGQLSPQEWSEMQRHPLLGAEMLVMMPGIDRAACVPVLEHHMRFDGQGYPRRAVERPLNLASRIIAVADAYDAMTSARSYSAARVQGEAMNLLAEGAGTSLDPVLVRLFVDMLGVYPPRSIVRLSTGEIAIVVAPTDGEPLRPTVRVIASPGGDLVTPFDIPLAERDDLSVETTLDPRLLNIDVEDYV